MAKFAIIVGINEYKKQGDLLYAESDAAEFADALARYCGFSYDEIALLTRDVNGGERVEPADVRAQFARAKERGELETFVFFFCGRGRLDEDRTTRRFCFSDVDDGELLESSFTLLDLLDDMREIQTTNALFFFDARPSEDEFTTKRELNAFDEFTEGVAALWKNGTCEAPNVLAINSCSNAQTSYDDAEYERGLASSHLTWIVKGFFTTEAPTLAQISERLPEVVAARADELRVGAQQGYQGADAVVQRPCCSLIGDGSYALTTQTISDEERATAVGYVVQRGEELFASNDYKRARLAAERALELLPNNAEARSLKNRAYRAEVSLVGAGQVFDETNAIIDSNVGARRGLFCSCVGRACLLGTRTCKALRWLTNFRDKGARRWKFCIWLLGVYLLCCACVGAVSHFFITYAEPSVLPPGIWTGSIPGDYQFLTINDVKFPFRYCPPGTFKMGSPWYEHGRDSDERRHKVILTKGFWILETETTQAMWRAVGEENVSYFEGDSLPVEQPSWFQCRDFVEKLNRLGVAPKGWKFSLPTEAQWEYACRAGEKESDVMSSLDDYAWYWDNTTETHEVGTKKPNAWGIYDMRGNVWEWCNDVYAPFLGNAVQDPQGPPERDGSMHVSRGGCWGGEDINCRAASRYGYFSSFEDSYRGFRIALIPIESEEQVDE